MWLRENIIEKAKKGNPKAINQLVELWYGRIYHFAYKYFFDHDMASEVAQQTCISMHEHLHNLENTDSFKPWLYRIAHNHCHQHDRKRKRKKEINQQEAQRHELDLIHAMEATDRQYNPAYKVSQTELSDILALALDELPDEQRDIVIMKEYEGLKFREIAEALQLSENTVKSRLYYGLKHLRKLLKEWHITKETIEYEA